MQYVAKMEELGLVHCIRSGVDLAPDFVSSVVLVKHSHSQWVYRFCGNFLQINSRVLPPHLKPGCKLVLIDLGLVAY